MFIPVCPYLLITFLIPLFQEESNLFHFFCNLKALFYSNSNFSSKLRYLHISLLVIHAVSFDVYVSIRMACVSPVLAIRAEQL